MIENVGRKLFLIGVLLATALLLLVIPERPIRMGLDIAGGTRLVYGLDFEAARASGAISPEETDAEVLSETIEIIRNRVDPDGVLEPVIRRAGSDRIEIQLPGTVDLGVAVKPVPLAREIPAEGTGIIQLGGEPAAYSAFPGGGGTVRIGAEDIRYGKRSGNELREIQRGAQGTAMQAHAAGAMVALVSDDSIKNAIENLGDLRFYPVAEAANFSVLGSDANAEIGKLRTWLGDPENAETSIAVYNALAPAEGGAPDGLLWFPSRRSEANEGLTRLEILDRGGFEPVLETSPEWTFSGADLERVFRTQDEIGYPAVGFEMSPSARVAFGEFTAEYVDRRLAIVLNDEVVTAPTLNEALYGTSQISGGATGFSDPEVRQMVTVLRSGSLQVKPDLVEQERVGATLGQDYVRRNFLSGFGALLLTFVFMIGYYRRLGVFACVALIANLLLLLGAMVALQATLTLPGIAGIILTVGMAVDGNILVFDRMREEAEKGRKPAQAAKEGFENALSAIIDSNVTTFLTAAILKYVGTGPVRGFATTLMIGIATTVFAVVVITRLLVDLQVKKGVQGWKMSRWLADADFDFLKYGKAAAIGSTLAIVIGLGVFISAPASEKYGIDFLGGARVKVRTEEPRSVDEVRTLVARIPGEIGTTAEVIALPISQDGEGYREFAISFKTPPGAESDTADHFAREIRTALAEVIQRGPIELSLDQGPEPRAHLVLYFETPHSTADLEQALAGVSLAELTVQHRAGQENVFEIGGVPQGLDEARLAGQVQSALAGQRDQSGREYVLAEPMPEASVIGAQVVGELRDSAIRAMLISVFLVVMYIRVRFAEYSYGFAAVAAVLHDVLIALGAIAVMVHLPFIEVEMNLTMIAAFLTILGYSLNDTIVIFDRVRENLPRVKGTFAEVVNLSINQTISRTITTSTTALFSVTTMLAFNLGTGNVLEGFMLALLVGFISGVYSTIYIACPLLIWLEKRSHKRPASEAALTSEKAQAAT